MLNIKIILFIFLLSTSYAFSAKQVGKISKKLPKSQLSQYPIELSIGNKFGSCCRCLSK